MVRDDVGSNALHIEFISPLQLLLRIFLCPFAILQTSIVLYWMRFGCKIGETATQHIQHQVVNFFPLVLLVAFVCARWFLLTDRPGLSSGLVFGRLEK